MAAATRSSRRHRNAEERLTERSLFVTTRRSRSRIIIIIIIAERILPYPKQHLECVHGYVLSRNYGTSRRCAWKLIELGPLFGIPVAGESLEGERVRERKETTECRHRRRRPALLIDFPRASEQNGAKQSGDPPLNLSPSTKIGEFFALRRWSSAFPQRARPLRDHTTKSSSSATQRRSMPLPFRSVPFAPPARSRSLYHSLFDPLLSLPFLYGSIWSRNARHPSHQVPLASRVLYN